MKAWQLAKLIDKAIEDHGADLEFVIPVGGVGFMEPNFYVGYSIAEKTEDTCKVAVTHVTITSGAISSFKA